jgi:hypothetical protein
VADHLTGPYTGRWFSPHAWCNKRLPDDASLDPDSDAYCDALADRALAARIADPDHPATHGISSFNWNNYARSVFIADDPDHYTLETFTFDRPDGQISATMMEAFTDVPVPVDARPAGPWPGDNHLVIYQPNDPALPYPDTYWEAWKASQFEVDGPHSGGQATGTDPAVLNTPGWHMEYGGRIDHMSGNIGIFDNTAYKGQGQGWGAAATKIPLMAGCITEEEALAAVAGTVGAIPHGLNFSLLFGAQWPKFRWPAQAVDGSSHNPFAPQEGMWFRLPPDYDPSGETDLFMREVVRAIRDYGMVVTDTAGAVTINMEGRATVPGAQLTNAIDIWLGTDNVTGPGHDGILKDFPTTLAGTKIPWTEMQLLDESYRPTQPIKQRLIIGTP